MQVRPSIEFELRAGERILEDAGVLNPKREATAIWAALEGCLPGDVWLRRAQVVSEDRAVRYREAVARRARGEPLPYVVGTTGFRTLEIKVDRRALIPRPETEGLVELVLEWARTREKTRPGSWGIAVDVGTGTGCIALSLAVEGRFDKIIATDSSSKALELAAENATAVAPRVPIDLREGSLLDAIGDMVVDVIVSNPPYVTAEEYAMLDPGVSEFEPREALVSGTHGVEHTLSLLRQASVRLAPGGLIAIEVDSTRAELVLDMAHQAGWLNARVEADLFGRPRFLHATKET